MAVWRAFTNKLDPLETRSETSINKNLRLAVLHQVFTQPVQKAQASTIDDLIAAALTKARNLLSILRPYYRTRLKLSY